MLVLVPVALIGAVRLIGVVLIGAVLLPVAVRVGFPVLGAAIAMNLFGHGTCDDLNRVLVHVQGYEERKGRFDLGQK